MSAPENKQEVFAKEEEKEQFLIKSKVDYKKLDAGTKQILIEKYITPPPAENYEND